MGGTRVDTDVSACSGLLDGTCLLAGAECRSNITFSVDRLLVWVV